jgi:IPT/TIG domain/FG-GAP-like repeat/FG-GAP repeat
MPASAAETIQYFGGPVVAQVKVVPVFWSSHVNATVQANMQQFFADAVNSPWYDALMQYSTNVNGGTNQTIVRGTVEAAVVLVPSLCAGTAACTMSDFQLQGELVAQITASALPSPDSNTVYMVFIPSNVTLTLANGGIPCYVNNTTQMSSGQRFPHGVVIDTFTGNGATGCGSNATALENETQLTATTLANIVTDPQIGFAGNPIAAPAAWFGTAIVQPNYPNGAGQVGDACATAAPGPTITVSGRTWTVASIFDDTAGSCNKGPFVDQTPSVTTIFPANGPAAGGTSVTIHGTNFTGTTSVNFGAATAASFAFIDSTQLTATAPAGGGTVDVTVTNAAGTSPTSAADKFTYLTTYDFDGDGMSDVLWRDTSGNVAIWEMNGTSISNLATSFVSQVPVAWSIVGTGDFNGDGKSDVLWRDTSGNFSIWEMNGTSVLNQATSFVALVPTAWSIVGSGDFNGDGKSDIAWYNGGNVAILEMNGTTILNQATSFVGQAPTVWTIQNPQGN